MVQTMDPGTILCDLEASVIQHIASKGLISPRDCGAITQSLIAVIIPRGWYDAHGKEWLIGKALIPWENGTVTTQYGYITFREPSL